MIEDNNYSGLSKHDSYQDKLKADRHAIDRCMPGSFMTTNYYPYFGTCPDLMSNRCSKTWDEKCELYLNNLDIHEAKDFLDKTALQKYTTFDKKNNTENCNRVYQLSDPLIPNSPMVSEIQGTQDFYMNDNGQMRFSDPGLSPTFRTLCEDVTDNLKPKYSKGDFSEKDGLFQNCMKYGTCRESLDLTDKTRTIYETRISKTRNNNNGMMPNYRNYSIVYENPFRN
jgi:hypothetical protein